MPLVDSGSMVAGVVIGNVVMLELQLRKRRQDVTVRVPVNDSWAHWNLESTQLELVQSPGQAKKSFDESIGTLSSILLNRLSTPIVMHCISNAV